jgi:GT2 family glycosyltransferase
MNLIFIADFFIEQISGGGELCTEEIIQYFIKQKFSIKKINSENVNVSFIKNNIDSFFIISNFTLLSEEVKNFISVNNIKYIIIEHDHKYCKSRNPSIYSNLVVPEEHIINRQFYKNSLLILAQSKKHCEIIEKNLWLDNVVSLSYNLWSDEHLDLMRQNVNNKKTIKYAVLNSDNPIKGRYQALDFCNKNNIKPTLISEPEPKKFIKLLSQVENLIFFPQSFETYSRLIIEAKILNCKVITNKSSGVVYEDYISKNGNDLLELIVSKKTEVLEKIKNFIYEKQNTFINNNFIKPKVSILTTIYKSGKYIDSFMKQFEKLEDFNKNELIIVDADSPDREFEIIEKYINKYSNIKYIKTNYCTTSEAINIAAKNASGEYFTFCFCDDKLSENHTTILSKHLTMRPDIDLVYGDVFVGNKINEDFSDSLKYETFEHSKNDFSKENMIKCLPGPMPLFRKTMFEKNNGFDEKMNFANDWDLWLRCIRNGSKFKKINKVVGLYYNNPQGNSTSQEDSKKIARQREEKQVFYNYKDVFGERNFNLYKSYFDSLS